MNGHEVTQTRAVIDPGALVRPNLAKWLWLLIFADGSVLRRFEPVGDERTPKAAT
jgi:hypothetical protein